MHHLIGKKNLDCVHDCVHHDAADPEHFPLPADTIASLAKLADTGLIADHPFLVAAADIFPIRIPGYLRSLIGSPDDPIGRQVIPTKEELRDLERSPDPLGEQAQSPTPLVIHRYPHRAAFLVSDKCAVHCRFCMRKRNVGSSTTSSITPQALGESLEYIRSRPQISEVILTGGDPLMLSDRLLLQILSALAHMRHISLLRIHTRVPGVLPLRITPGLVKKLSTFHPLFINMHFNHPHEITSQTAAVCARLSDAGIVLGSQTVLLRGINDDSDTLRRLMNALLAIRVRPYAIHQLDRMPGNGHFQVPLDRAVSLVGALRGPLSGMAVPHLMVDLPGGGGKVALCAQAVAEKHKGRWTLRNWQGKLFGYEWK
jgi:lysine 2,3-aminomutase